MRSMKKEEVKTLGKKRTASKGAGFGVIAACLGIMIATVAKGIQLDKKEAEESASKDNQ